MKNLILYSTDFSMCLSLLMYLQNSYQITTTTDLDVLQELVKNPGFDLLIMDAEPTKNIESFCKNLKLVNPSIQLFLSYVYRDNSKEFDVNIRKYAKTIFYKPFDLPEITKQLSFLTVQ